MIFKEADEETVCSLANLSTRSQATADTLTDPENLVCQRVHVKDLHQER